MNSTLHMVVEINPDALDIARELDGERKSGKVRGYVLIHIGVSGV